MQGIIFVFDQARTVKNRLFTVRIQERKKEGKIWVPAAPRGFYTARDLQQTGVNIFDKKLFSLAFQSETDLRKQEARFFSMDAEVSLFRISPHDLESFLAGCRSANILCQENGRSIRFRYIKNTIPDIRFEASGTGFIPAVFLDGKKADARSFAMVSNPIRILSGRSVYELVKGVPVRVLAPLVSGRTIPSDAYGGMLEILSRYAGKLTMTLPGQKEIIRNGSVTPVLDLDNSFRFARLSFLYEGAGRFPMGDSRKVIFDPGNNRELHRNFTEETKFRHTLEVSGAIHRPTSRGEWFIPEGKREEILRGLKKNGFHLTLSGRPLLPDIRIDWEVRVKDQQLSVGGEVRCGEERTDMENILDAYLSRQPWFDLPGGFRGYIPARLARLFQTLEQRGDFRDEDILFAPHDFSFVADLLKGEKTVSRDRRFGEYLSFLEGISGKPRAIRTPPSLRATLRPYQEAGFNWLAGLQKFGFGGILADDMGLGKTIQVLALLLHLKGNNPVHSTLLILPKTLVWNWESEIERFAPALDIIIHMGPGRAGSPAGFSEKDLVITSYGTARQDSDLLGRVSWDLVVLDEAQAVKNPGAKISRAVKTLTSANRIALTGTPIENRPLDLWSLFDFLMPGFLGDRAYFQKAYQSHDPKALDTLGVLTAPFILRRMKHQVCKELPDKTEITLFCGFSEEQKNCYDEILAAGKKELSREPDGGQSNGFHTMEVLTLLLKLRQAACHPAPAVGPDAYTGSSGKFEVVLETAQGILKSGYKILIFSQFVALLELVKEMFEAHGIEQHHLYGSTRQRKQVVDRFKQSGKPSVFLISLKAGGVGLNLTEAGYVFLLDPWWNPAVENQAIDRSYRIGQENPVTVYRFITKDSVEENVIRLKEKKKQMESAVLDHNELKEIPFSKKELLGLIR